MVVKQILKNQFGGIYEQANDNQTALIKASKRNPNARKMQAKVKTSREKNQLTNGRKCNSLHLLCKFRSLCEAF